jgi:hypothetical protein
MTWLDKAIEGVRAHDRARPRAQQAEVGWSEAGGCQSAIGYRVDGAWPARQPGWAAVRGTALHDYLLPVIGQALGIAWEVETVYRGIPGHADLVGPNDVTDLKTKTLDAAATWRANVRAMWQPRVQAHGYAAGLVDAGRLREDATVRILVAPVDTPDFEGELNTDGWWAFEEPFDRDLADQGADRVDRVRAEVAAGRLDQLPKEKPPQWCAKFCEFAPLCRPDLDAELAGEDFPEITDPELATAVRRYGELLAVWSPAEAEKKALAPMVRGLRGRTADGWKVTTSRPGEPGEEPDMDAVREILADFGIELPMRKTPGSSPRLSVTRIKDKEAAK